MLTHFKPFSTFLKLSVQNSGTIRLVNREASQHSPETKERRSHVRRKLMAGFLGGTVLSVVGILTLDSEMSEAKRIPVEPSVTILDTAITYTQNPAETTRTQQVSPERVEQCRESKFVVVFISGTGMEVSFYSGNNVKELVEGMDGCVMYLLKGTSNDEHLWAKLLEKAVDEVTPEGEQKDVMLVGGSEGGIVAEDIASDPAIENSKNMKIKQILMLMTPVDMNDTLGTFFGMPIPWLDAKTGDLPKFGNFVVLMNGMNGQSQRDDLLNWGEWQMTFDNAAKTDASRLRYDVERIRRGMQRLNPNIDITYVAADPNVDYRDQDKTVNGMQAYQRIVDMMKQEGGAGQVSFILLNTRGFRAGGHDNCWLSENQQECNRQIFEPVLRKTFTGDTLSTNPETGSRRYVPPRGR